MEQKHTFSIIACFGKFSDIDGRFSVIINRFVSLITKREAGNNSLSADVRSSLLAALRGLDSYILPQESRRFLPPYTLKMVNEAN